MTAKDQNKELLRAGAYLLPDAPLDKDVHTDAIDVRVYTHPALGDRTIARLTPNNLALGEDNAMSFFGFGAPTVTESVAKRARQALGFPEWVLVHDAKNAQKALEIAKKLKKAARRAKSKPGHAKDDFDAMGKELSKKLPHFLPSYYEEVARAFLEAGNTSYAASSFGKAREAEKVYALEVDEERRREAFLEFALNGALTNKVMTEYAGDLSQRHGAEKAYDYFFDLAVRRTLGGTPPHAQMVTQLRKLAKAAGHKQADEDIRFVSEIWDSPSVNKAPKKYWDTYKKAYAAIAKDRPEVRGRLINTFPSPSGKADGFKQDWLDFLELTGALDAVVNEDAASIPEAAQVDEGAAAWLARMLQHRMDGGYYWRRSSLPDAMFGLLRRMAPRLKKDGTPLQFDRQDGWYSWVDIDLLDLGLELGISVAALEDHSSFELQNWAEPDEESEERPRDLKFVGQDDRFEDKLDSAVGSVFGNSTFQKAAFGCEGLEVARRKWLERRAQGFGNGALPALFDNINELVNNTSAGTFAEFPEAYSKLLNADPVGAVQRTFNIGLVDEFTWPAFEEAYRELQGPKQDIDVNVEGVFPYLVLRNNLRAIVVGAEGRVLEHDFQLPGNSYPRQIRYSQGQILVVFYNQDWEMTGYWSNSPKHHFKIDYYPGGGDVAVELEDGSMTEGARALVAGDETPANGQTMVSDGASFWRLEGYWSDRKLVEYDPKTGQTGRSSLPAFFEDFAATGKKIDLGNSKIYPLPKGVTQSILGGKDGLYGWRVRTDEDDNNREIERIDGHKYTGKGYTNGLASFPGDDTLRAVSSGCVWDYDCAMSSDNEYSVHNLEDLPLSCWHFMRPRDEAASAFMRAMDDGTARAILAPALLCKLNEQMPQMHGGSEYLANQLEACGAQLAARSDAPTNKLLKPALEDYVTWLRGGEQPKRLDGEDLLESVVANATQGADAGIQASLKHVLIQAADGISRFGQMLTNNHPDNAGAVGGDMGLTDEELSPALGGVMSSGYYRQSGHEGLQILPQMQLVSHYLRTGEVTGKMASMQSRFHKYIGQPGILAYFSAAPSLEAKDRESLRTFLRLFKDTGFADMGGKIRVMTGVGDKEVFGDSGAWLRTEDGTTSRYWGFMVSNWDELNLEIIEYNEDGKFNVPKGFTVESEWHAPVGNWGSSEQIEAFLEAAEAAEGEMEFNKAAAEQLSDKTGLTYAEAALLLTGLPNVRSWETNFLPKPLREAMGLKVKEADAGRQTLRNLDEDKKLEIFANAIPEDPTKLFNPMGDGPDDDQNLASTMASSWNAAMGQRVSLPEELLLQLEKDLETGADRARMLLSAIIEPDQPSPFTMDSPCVIKKYDDDDSLTVVAEDTCFTMDVLSSTCKLIAYLLGAVDAGDTIRTNAPTLYDLAMERLKYDELMLFLDSEYLYEEDARKNYMDAIGTIKRIAGQEYADAGLIVAIPTRWNVGVYFRPALRLKGESHPIYETKATELGGYYNHVPTLERFLSDEFKAIVERLRNSPLEPGQFESNPQHSAPDVVKAIGAKHDLSEDAAVLYAQTLALHNPTTKLVREWNDWTAGRYKKAAEALAERELLIEAKRARAGRKHFLPGGWEALKKPNLPIETWKLPMYEASPGGAAPLGLILPLKPIHTLFEEAWNRIESGDLPSF